MSLILAAARFASQHHHGIRRKWRLVDYIHHPGRVAARISRHPFSDETWVAAAWLHDTLEDPSGYGKTVNAAELHHALVAFMPLWMPAKEWETQVRETVGIVIDLTNPSKKHPELPREQRKKMDRDHLRRTCQGARCIKLADRADNLNDMDGSPADFRQLYARESADLLIALKGTDKELESELETAIYRVRHAPA